MNQMNCLGWRSLAVKLSCLRHVTVCNLLILQAFTSSSPTAVGAEQWARESARTGTVIYHVICFEIPLIDFTTKEICKRRAPLHSVACSILWHAKVAPCLSPVMTLLNGAHLYLPRFKEELPSFSLSSLFPFLSNLGRKRGCRKSSSMQADENRV